MTSSAKLKPSFYNFYFHLDNTPFVYNTLYTSLAQLDENTRDSLENNKLEGISQNMLDSLVGQHFVVPKDYTESKEYLYFYDRVRLGGGAKLLSITLVPTYNCNLACPYCLQGLNKKNTNMTPEDVMKVVTFARKTIANSRSVGVPISRINVRLYGGEPMMQKRCLSIFCEEMKKVADEYSCAVNYSMVSNMTLLDDELFELIKKFNINVQVSIDGTEEEHNKRRIDRKGRGTYTVITNNLKKLKEAHMEENVVIRINLDKDNLHSAETVMENVHQYSTDVYFGYLENFQGFNDACTNCLEKKPLPVSEVTEKLNVIMRKYGYRVPEEFGKMAPCALNFENKFFVDCYLNVYKCELALNQPELSVGTISDEGEFIPNKNFYRQMDHSPRNMPECMACNLLPLCGGGCAAKAYIESGAKDGNLDRSYCACTKESLEIHLKNFVQRLLNEQQG
jgi:uncharacterized protein